MKKMDAVAALAALAQETRLDIFRLLVQAGAAGMPAGRIGELLGLPSPTLAFHLKQLKYAGLVTFTRVGRSLIYTAAYAKMGELLPYLTENCCKGVPAARGDHTTPSAPAPEASGQRHLSGRAVAAAPAHC
jgi:ArsR family transcriptional regulator, arsenate/arsenite/antimonite-responsive transcriptional repressor